MLQVTYSGLQVHEGSSSSGQTSFANASGRLKPLIATNNSYNFDVAIADPIEDDVAI